MPITHSECSWLFFVLYGAVVSAGYFHCPTILQNLDPGNEGSSVLAVPARTVGSLSRRIVRTTGEFFIGLHPWKAEGRHKNKTPLPRKRGESTAKGPGDSHLMWGDAFIIKALFLKDKVKINIFYFYNHFFSSKRTALTRRRGGPKILSSKGGRLACDTEATKSGWQEKREKEISFAVKEKRKKGGNTAKENGRGAITTPFLY